ncbi:hypothetical protein AUEXF2481DRAFT_68062 [Aureobasidium subglaciale EXF-2481]|uniref:NFX1-type zinc finger-containing protein 1 n=1 Tax=Aureobasidium subglaciale (strain EXF-2481) TaxID=1043005 RepID=A0A074Y580_AURSE|nr:uncharacterized protein AUEXF2481DRAFT_68062 [Aureobasidium subglaciale EXF-2481]KEQ92875.1 hypothetical protein AUEXF2481DRAFT_68062 [Aureobasidium subglaciale EXF-2481]
MNRKPGICHAFQRGKCHYGARCKFSHDLTHEGHTSRLRPCNLFKTPQGCKFGTACKFSHDRTSQNQDDDTTTQEFDKWRQQLTQRQPLGFGLGKFFEQTLQLVNLDNACRQEVVRTLASDRGLIRILELVSQNFDTMSDKTTEHVFTIQIVPLFRALSEEHVMSSPLLERHLGDICIFMYGVGGIRGEKLFATVVRALSASMHNPDVKFYVSLEASLAVLSKIVEFNSTAKVTPIFGTYASTMAAMMTPQNDEAADVLRCQAEKHLDGINKRLGIGKTIRNIATSNTQDLQRPVFKLQRDYPGRLANGRPRHDNDFESIENIQIMPTSDEIKSPHAEYLPLQDPSTWHKQGLEGLLDRHFRLLREDTVGQLRDSARIELEALQGPGSAYSPRNNTGTLKKHTYHNALVEHPKFEPRNGLEFVISFDQPIELQSKSNKKRSDWWRDSKRLEGDALVCLISSTQAIVFCSISFPDDPARRPEREAGETLDPHQNITSYDTDRVRVIARPVEMDSEAVAHILGTFSHTNIQGGRSLVEFPGVLLPAFLPTLTALQTLSRNGVLPFSTFLAPLDVVEEQDTMTIPPPAYARRAGFRFKLDLITEGSKNHSYDPASLERSDVEELKKMSTLDETQATALLTSLSRSFALIQGPPGTGKSYTGVALVKTLVNNRKVGKLGPILVVTFTNHALDQSLEHLLDEGIAQVVRIGSRSKSERLTDLNLRKVAEKAGKTKVEKSEYGKARGQMKDEARAINESLVEISQDIQLIRNYLARSNSSHDAYLFGAQTDAEGFVTVQHSTPEERLKSWLRGGKHIRSNMPTQTVAGVADLGTLSYVERHKLHNHWLRRARQPLIDAIMDRVEQFEDHQLHLNHVRNELDLRVLEQADVVGVTTSGLARNLSLLRRLPSKVLLCEEAGEVLESHLLTALLPSVEHAILIGDHLQLRPHIQCYDLSQESIQGQQYSLDTSLFERLVTATDGGIRLPFSRLDTQRRMHPSIAELVRSTLYPTLSDAPSTLTHPEVAGMRKRLFWLDHQHPETHGGAQSTSHTNDYEVEMTTALVSHLIKQGTYKPGAIAVLTPYLGQLRKLRLRMQSSFEVLLDDRDVKSLQDEGMNDAAQVRAPLAPGVQKGSIASAVRIATVDNFQGEEAEVVIISLVRSNQEQKCGFLRTSNRINVLLSRAKNGMYIIGNSATTQHIPMWAEVLQILQIDSNFGEVLELACPRHPEDEMNVAEPDDFIKFAPDGGCVLPCAQRLNCGHHCDSRCHSQTLHDAVKCLAPCPRQPGTHSCSHACPRVCGEVCPPRCMEIVKDISVQLPCGHVKDSLPCWLYHEQDEIRCDEIVQRTVPGCGHDLQLRCCIDVTEDHFLCRVKCGNALTCGHTCNKPCHTCKKRNDCIIVEEEHGQCRQQCGRDFNNCNHSCIKTCHGDADCGVCTQPCEVRCSHSSCPSTCSEPCPPCAEQTCSSSCAHSKCNMPCAAPCDWVPCSLRCEKILPCSHQCPSVDGAACPDIRFCQECGSDDIKARVVDLIMMSTYNEIDLQEDPCIFPACGHFYTVSTMDGHLSLGEHYVVDGDGLPVALKTPEDNLDVDKTRMVCPDCRRSLRDIPRYGRIIRRALLIQSTLKFITWSNNLYVSAYGSFSTAQNTLKETLEEAKPAEIDLHLVGSRSDQIQVIHVSLSKRRYANIVALRHSIDNFRGLVRKDEQPFKRVQELVRYARKQKQTQSDFVFDDSVILQTRSSSLASALLLRCDLVILSDVLAIRSSKPLPFGTSTTLDFTKNRRDCEALFLTAQEGLHHLQQAEALIFWAHFAALEISWRSTHEEESGSNALDTLRAQAKNHLAGARTFCAEHSQARVVESEIEEVVKMLRESTFYSPVTNEEMKNVVAAMAREFRGTGHWYRCENGHPFTVGECGMPMQTARCPQCGGVIGGQGHQAAAGVARANDIEREFGNMRL